MSKNNDGIYIIRISNSYYWVGANLISEQIRNAKMYVSLKAARKTISDLQNNPNRKRLIAAQVLDRKNDGLTAYSKSMVIDNTIQELVFEVVEIEIVEKSVI